MDNETPEQKRERKLARRRYLSMQPAQVEYRRKWFLENYKNPEVRAKARERTRAWMANIKQTQEGREKLLAYKRQWKKRPYVREKLRALDRTEKYKKLHQLKYQRYKKKPLYQAWKARYAYARRNRRYQARERERRIDWMMRDMLYQIRLVEFDTALTEERIRINEAERLHAIELAQWKIKEADLVRKLTEISQPWLQNPGGYEA